MYVTYADMFSYTIVLLGIITLMLEITKSKK